MINILDALRKLTGQKSMRQAQADSYLQKVKTFKKMANTLGAIKTIEEQKEKSLNSETVLIRMKENSKDIK